MSYVVTPIMSHEYFHDNWSTIKNIYKLLRIFMRISYTRYIKSLKRQENHTEFKSLVNKSKTIKKKCHYSNNIKKDMHNDDIQSQSSFTAS